MRDDRSVTKRSLGPPGAARHAFSGVPAVAAPCSHQPRQVSAGGLRLLIADYTVTCYDEGGGGPSGGGVNAGYLPLLVAGVVLTFVWVLGVPLYFGVQLYRHRAIIQVNRSN